MKSPAHTRGTGRPSYYRDTFECPDCGYECDIQAKLTAQLSQLKIRLHCPMCNETFACTKHVTTTKRGE